jgi:hypothetical protein
LAAFKKFNAAFAGLLGRSGPLTDPEMQAFTGFVLQATYPPNPIQRRSGRRHREVLGTPVVEFSGLSTTF